MHAVSVDTQINDPGWHYTCV